MLLEAILGHFVFVLNGLSQHRHAVVDPSLSVWLLRPSNPQEGILGRSSRRWLPWCETCNVFEGQLTSIQIHDREGHGRVDTVSREGQFFGRSRGSSGVDCRTTD